MDLNDFTGIFVEDFSNSYEQMRYYDTQINELMKFSIGLYTTLIAALITLIGVSNIPTETLTKILIYSSLVITFFGVIILFTVIKNRVYFVKTARYINEIRLIAINGIKFENQAKMYCSINEPKYFSISSTQIILSFLCSVFNSICFSFTLYKLLSLNTLLFIICILMSELIQFGFIYIYLSNKEKKS